MLKLRHLFTNDALAHMLLKNWDNNENELNTLQMYRISANAIYQFKTHDQVRFLRFCPTSEKHPDNLIAELDFITYLREKGYNALESVKTRAGASFALKETPWGEYSASVFKQVPGHPLSQLACEDEIVFLYGATLGQLHWLSSQYIPSTRRWTYSDVLTWVKDVLGTLPGQQSALWEAELLSAHFARLPQTPANYGLIHYDFEVDNVFYEQQTRTCHVIDFDDSMYHWYVMDIAQALTSLEEENQLSEMEFSQKRTKFLDGYRSQFELSDESLKRMPVCQRFANLYGYTRIARAVSEEWEHEPEWLVNLRQKLRAALTYKSTQFGQPIVI